MVSRRYSQKGITFPGAVFAIFLAVFSVSLLFKLGPLYTEHATIKTAMESLKSQPDLASNSREMIIELLNKRLQINNVSALLPQNITVIKHGSYVRVQITYDQTVPLFGNLDAVAHFDDFFEVGSEVGS